MTSARQRTANRTNASLSTGPKTAKGKARAAKNALRHGLSLPVLGDPVLTAEVENLARHLAGAKANGEVLAGARRVAEAHIDLQRVRLYRQRRMMEAFATSNCQLDTQEATVAGGSLASASAKLVKELQRLDRYERRALSRRKFSIRAWDSRCRTHGNCFEV